MENRAILRVTSPHMTNWLHHVACTRDQLTETMKHMAKVVDENNASDPAHRAMAPNFDDSIAFHAACNFVFERKQQPSVYTRPLLHARQLKVKRKTA